MRPAYVTYGICEYGCPSRSYELPSDLHASGGWIRTFCWAEPTYKDFVTPNTIPAELGTLIVSATNASNSVHSIGHRWICCLLFRLAPYLVSMLSDIMEAMLVVANTKWSFAYLKSILFILFNIRLHERTSYAYAKPDEHLGYTDCPKLKNISVDRISWSDWS